MSWMETVSYLILVLCFSAVPWATRRAGWVLLAAGLGTSVVAIAAGIVAEARLYPLTDLRWPHWPSVGACCWDAWFRLGSGPWRH
jgi:hypothetical protein